jgi:hypothetical protein
VGGFGSGRWNQHNKKRMVEDCWILKPYLPPGERRFGCRECHSLNYESSQQSHKYDGLYALLAGGECEGETYEFLKGAFSYITGEERRRRAEGQGGWLEDFESFPGEDSQPLPSPLTGFAGLAQELSSAQT